MGKYCDIYKHTLKTEGDTILALQDSLDYTVMDEIVDLLLTVKHLGHKVIVAGAGTSGIVARKIAHTLSVIEVPAFPLLPDVSIHGGMGAIQRDDIVVLLTKGGNTEEMLQYLPVCKAKGAKVVGVSEDKDSALAKGSDIFLLVRIDHEPCPWNLIASGSSLAVLAVWDAIVFAVMAHSGYTKKDLLLTHQGGAVGYKLIQGSSVNQ